MFSWFHAGYCGQLARTFFVLDPAMDSCAVPSVLPDADLAVAVEGRLFRQRPDYWAVGSLACPLLLQPTGTIWGFPMQTLLAYNLLGYAL